MGEGNEVKVISETNKQSDDVPDERCKWYRYQITEEFEKAHEGDNLEYTPVVPQLERDKLVTEFEEKHKKNLKVDVGNHNEFLNRKTMQEAFRAMQSVNSEEESAKYKYEVKQRFKALQRAKQERLEREKQEAIYMQQPLKERFKQSAQKVVSNIRVNLAGALQYVPLLKRN